MAFIINFFGIARPGLFLVQSCRLMVDGSTDYKRQQINRLILSWNSGAMLIPNSMFEMGANRTFMLVVVEGTAGLPFECAGCVARPSREHSVIVCKGAIAWLMSSVFILVRLSIRNAGNGRDVTKSPRSCPVAHQARFRGFFQKTADRAK